MRTLRCLHVCNGRVTDRSSLPQMGAGCVRVAFLPATRRGMIAYPHQPTMTGLQMKNRMPPPVAAVRPHQVRSPHGVRSDDYYWLRDDTRSAQDVLDYLHAENAYRETMTARLRPLEQALYDEIVGRIQQDDTSVPYRDNGYWYCSRYHAGDEYPVHLRRAGSGGHVTPPRTPAFASRRAARPACATARRCGSAALDRRHRRRARP
jgi:hypothetical protein